MTKDIDIHGRYFWYLGNGGEKYGPHNERQMLTWYRESFLSSDVRIAEGDLCDGPDTFKPLGVYLKERGVANPFMPFDCVQKEDLVHGTVVRRIQEHMHTEIKEMADILATGLANISLCLAKDGETMHADLMKQMEEMRKRCHEESDRAKRDNHASFERSSLGPHVFTGAVPSSLSSEWMSGMKTKMDEIANVAVSFKIDSEFALQKIDGLQHMFDGLLERVDASADSLRVDVDNYESALQNVYDFLRNIAERMNGVLEGRSDGLPNIVHDLTKVANIMVGLGEQVRRNPKDDDQWKQLLVHLTDIYDDLTTLQQHLIAAFCTRFFPEEPAATTDYPLQSLAFTIQTPRVGKEFRERGNIQFENRRRGMSDPPAPPRFRRNNIRHQHHNKNNNYSCNSHCNNSNMKTSSLSHHPTSHLAQDHVPSGGFTKHK